MPAAPGRGGWVPLLLGAALTLLLSLSPLSWAARIGIDASHDPDSRLEIRTVVLPDGSEVQLYVLLGSGLSITIDDSLLEADHVEVDLTNRLVRVIGFGRYTSGSEVIAGDDLVIDLRDESFAGDDVLLISDQVEVRGDRASRVPGLIRVAMGQFSPCTRCGQDIEDYGFSAERLEIYPGDRLVGYDVTVLIRGAAVLTLPIMVLPIGPQDRLPRFEYLTGTATERARITLSWPYVAGPHAYGDVGVRYYADVVPGGSRVGDALLGGAVARSYVGGFLQHRFYTERGKGRFGVDYTPAFETADGRTEPLFQVRFEYADEEVIGPPRTTLLVTRDDHERERYWEATLTHDAVTQGVRGRFSSQLYLDLDLEGPVRTPSYASRTVPLMTVARLQLEPEEVRGLSVGPLRVDRLLLDLGVFQDRSNPINRSAAVTPFVTAGRVVEGHTLVLAPLPLWSGMTLEGRTAFTGYYYATAERQVEWLSTLTARQAFGRTGILSFTFTRDVREGETPFRFDLFPYRSRTDLRGQLRLDPAPWLRFEQRGGYVFLDDRNPGDEGWLPLETTLTLLRNLDWVTLTLRNEYDPEEGDPGTLDVGAELRTRGTFAAQLELTHSQDLSVRPDRLTGEPRDTSRTSVRASAGVANVFDVRVETAYRYDPPPGQPGEPLEHFDDLSVRLTLGTLRHDDRVPGLAVTYAHDLNVGQVSAFEVAAALTLGPVELDAMQRLSLPTGRLARSQLRVAWPGVAAAQAEGLVWLPTGWLGFPQPEPYARNLLFTLEEAPERGSPTWQVRYGTRLDPSLGPPGGYGFRNSTLTGRVLLEDRLVGPVRFSVDGFAELLWSDDVQPSTYLRRANLRFGVDVYERVGLQGTVGYVGQYSLAAAEVTSARLSLQEVALVVRPFDSLYLGAVITDVWDLTGNDASQPAFNLQPTFVAVWNRCCWALYGSWNSATGAVAITLTTPGADQGIGNVFDTGWLIPRRQP